MVMQRHATTRRATHNAWRNRTMHAPPAMGRPDDWQRARLEILVPTPSIKSNFCFIGRVAHIYDDPSFCDSDEVVDMDSVQYGRNKITNEGALVHWEGSVSHLKFLRQKRLMWSAKKNKRWVTVMIKNGVKLRVGKLKGRYKKVASDNTKHNKSKAQRELSGKNGILGIVPRVGKNGFKKRTKTGGGVPHR